MFTDRIPGQHHLSYRVRCRLNASNAVRIPRMSDAGEYTTTPDARVRVTLGALTQASGNQTIEFAVLIN